MAYHFKERSYLTVVTLAVLSFHPQCSLSKGILISPIENSIDDFTPNKSVPIPQISGMTLTIGEYNGHLYNSSGTELKTDDASPNEHLLNNMILTICDTNINQQRANNGKAPVASQSQVEQAAYNHNSHMLNNNCFSHQCPGEPPLGDRLSATGFRWSGVGEILAKGQKDCPAAVNAWMNSPGHKSILLGNYKYVGCSGLTCSTCPDKGPWWTCVFAN